MAIITECRFCNADKSTCEIKMSLSSRLKKAGIKETLRYRCKEWQQHRKYKVGDSVEFRFIEASMDPESRGWHFGNERLVGMISGVSERKPVYFITIDQATRDLLKGKHYEKFVCPTDAFDEGDTYTVPVKESFIVGLLNRVT